MPDNQPSFDVGKLIQEALTVLPELQALAKEGFEGITAQFSDLPPKEKRREARVALMSAYAPIDKLRQLPDFVDEAYEAVVDRLLDLAFPSESA